MRGHPECLEDVAALGVLELHQLHRAGADVETEGELALCHDVSAFPSACILVDRLGGGAITGLRGPQKNIHHPRPRLFRAPLRGKNLLLSWMVRPHGTRILRFCSLLQSWPHRSRALVD